jgi:Zn-finger nucleic acid-binding protein
VQAGAGQDRVVIDRCPRGHGLWFDPGELQRVLASRVAASDPALARIRAHLSAFERPPAKEQA